MGSSLKIPNVKVCHTDKKHINVSPEMLHYTTAFNEFSKPVNFTHLGVFQNNLPIGEPSSNYRPEYNTFTQQGCIKLIKKKIFHFK